jgi:cytochrome bd-type quinol oxidase subunit 2
MNETDSEGAADSGSDFTNLPLDTARSHLTAIWLIGGGLMFAILVLQSILGKYGGQMQQAWSWFIPTIMPTLSLMLGVIGASALGQKDPRNVRRDFYNIARWLSIAYLTVLALTILLEPFSPMKDPTELFTVSNYWLTPLQGLVVGVIGVLFTANQKAAGRVRSQRSSA